MKIEMKLVIECGNMCRYKAWLLFIIIYIHMGKAGETVADYQYGENIKFLNKRLLSDKICWLVDISNLQYGYTCPTLWYIYMYAA